MLTSIRRFVEQRVVPESHEESPEAREHALRLAAATLLVEVSRADNVIADEERTVMRAAIQGTSALSKQETEEPRVCCTCRTRTSSMRSSGRDRARADPLKARAAGCRSSGSCR